MVLPVEELEDQAILDDHVSRVWTDKTPLRSPGDPAGRPRSPPGGGRRGVGKPPIQTPLGPMAAHRYIDGVKDRL